MLTSYFLLLVVFLVNAGIKDKKRKRYSYYNIDYVSNAAFNLDEAKWNLWKRTVPEDEEYKEDCMSVFEDLCAEDGISLS
jgi:hypothetical protein